MHLAGEVYTPSEHTSLCKTTRRPGLEFLAKYFHPRLKFLQDAHILGGPLESRPHGAVPTGTYILAGEIYTPSEHTSLCKTTRRPGLEVLAKYFHPRLKFVQDAHILS